MNAYQILSKLTDACAQDDYTVFFDLASHYVEFGVGFKFLLESDQFSLACCINIVQSYIQNLPITEASITIYSDTICTGDLATLVDDTLANDPACSELLTGYIHNINHFDHAVAIDYDSWIHIFPLTIK